MQTQTDTPRRYEHTVAEMTNLHAILHSAMYVPGGMPDEAMNSLRDAHATVVDELSAMPSTDHYDLRLKRHAFSIMTGAAEVESCWPRHIKTLADSIAADTARLPPAYMMAAE